MHAGPDSSGGGLSGLAWALELATFVQRRDLATVAGVRQGQRVGARPINVQRDRARESWEAEPLQIFPVRLPPSCTAGIRRTIRSDKRFRHLQTSWSGRA